MLLSVVTSMMLRTAPSGDLSSCTMVRMNRSFSMARRRTWEMSDRVRMRPERVAVLGAEGDDAGHVVALADGELADGAVLGRGGERLDEGGEGAAGQQFAGRAAQHVRLAHVQERRHGLVGQHHVAVLVDHQHRVAQRGDEGVGLGLLFGQGQEAGLVLPAQPFLLGAGLLALDQGLDDAQQVVGHEGLGQEEVDALEGGRAGQVDVGVGGDHAGHERLAGGHDLLVQRQAVGVGQAVVEQSDVEVGGGEERESLLAGAGAPRPRSLPARGSVRTAERTPYSSSTTRMRAGAAGGAGSRRAAPAAAAPADAALRRARRQAPAARQSPGPRPAAPARS